jgi:hypothetical protein
MIGARIQTTPTQQQYALAPFTVANHIGRDPLLRQISERIQQSPHLVDQQLPLQSASVFAESLRCSYQNLVALI